MPDADFRKYLIPTDDPRIAAIRGLDVRQYREHATTDPFAGPMIQGWAELYPEAFRGITSDGNVVTGLFPLSSAAPGEEAPVAEMLAAAEALLGTLDADGTATLRYPLDAQEWRSWANPEFLQHDTGLRLDEVTPATRAAALDLVAATLSPAGYRLARNLMTINGFLGDLVGVPQLMNENSYNVALYGTPSSTEPWGWHLFGHHLAVNALVVGDRLVVTPVFFGAEPHAIDDAAATAVAFGERIAIARDLMAALPDDLRRRAQVYEQLVDPAMPPGRLHPGDERTLAGCFQDNRVIPYEGVRLNEMPAAARDLVRRLTADFLSYLPAGALAARLREVDAAGDETWFCWIGGWRDGEPFYCRIQSPVLLAELDHHCGVFLTNTEPAAFHIHTIVRTPNAGDYGRALVEQHLGHPLTH